MGQRELPRRAVLHGDARARVRLDQLGMNEAARPQVHPVLLFALTPQRHADVTNAHRLGRSRAPGLLEPGPEDGLAAARLARHEHALDARSPQVDVVLGGRLDRVGGVGGCQHRGLRPEALDRLQQVLGVAAADRNVTQADAVEGRERGAGHERPGVVGRDDALPGADAGGGVAAGRAGHPVLEIARRQRDVAGRAGRSARRVDPGDLGWGGTQMRADRVLRRAGRPELVLVGERQVRDLGEAAGVPF